MPVILCYGDSNTWGYDAAATATSPFPIRHPRHVRWTGVLASRFGPDFQIIEEGQNGRTTVHDDPLAVASRNGRVHLPVVLESHKPIDVIVLMLGTNDLKTVLAAPAQDIAGGVGLLVKLILQSDAGPDGKAPQVLLVCPPSTGDFAGMPDLAARFVGAREKSLEFPRLYSAVAEQFGIGFLNAQAFVEPTILDGLHLDASSHSTLGNAIADVLAGTYLLPTLSLSEKA
jgi:lysophospholipase L1-like esterase